MEMRRWAGSAGLVFVGLVGAANLGQGGAGRPFGDSNATGHLVDYLAYYSDGGWVLTLLGITLPFVWAALAVFAVGFGVTLARREWRAPGSAWALVGFIGVIMQNAIFPVVVALDTAQFRFVADEGAMDLGLHHAHEVLFGLNSLSLAIALTGFSAAFRRSGSGYRWLPWVGFSAATLLTVSTMNLGVESGVALFDGAGLLGFVLWLGFIITASIWLLRQPTDTRHSSLEASTSEASHH